MGKKATTPPRPDCANCIPTKNINVISLTLERLSSLMETQVGINSRHEEINEKQWSRIAAAETDIAVEKASRNLLVVKLGFAFFIALLVKDPAQSLLGWFISLVQSLVSGTPLA